MMEVIIGIIAEGQTDQVVLMNLLRGLKIDGANIKFIQPKDKIDDTDQKYLGWSYTIQNGKEIIITDVNEKMAKYLSPNDKILEINQQKVSPRNLYDLIKIAEPIYDVQIEREGKIVKGKVPNLMDLQGGWTRVKEICQSRERLEEFFAIQLSEKQYMLIQLDTAEANHEGFDVVKPEKDKNPAYTDDLRQLVIEKINEWLGSYTGKLLYAISIEELEAWILTLFEEKDSISHADPKKTAVKYIHEYKGNQGQKLHQKYHNATQDFSKSKKLAQARNLNQSLHHFLLSVEEKMKE